MLYLYCIVNFFFFFKYILLLAYLNRNKNYTLRIFNQSAASTLRVTTILCGVIVLVFMWLPQLGMIIIYNFFWI